MLQCHCQRKPNDPFRYISELLVRVCTTSHSILCLIKYYSPNSTNHTKSTTLYNVIIGKKNFVLMMCGYVVQKWPLGQGFCTTALRPCCLPRPDTQHVVITRPAVCAKWREMEYQHGFSYKFMSLSDGVGPNKQTGPSIFEHLVMQEKYIYIYKPYLSSHSAATVITHHCGLWCKFSPASRSFSQPPRSLIRAGSFQSGVQPSSYWPTIDSKVTQLCLGTTGK